MGELDSGTRSGLAWSDNENYASCKFSHSLHEAILSFNGCWYGFCQALCLSPISEIKRVDSEIK